MERNRRTTDMLRSVEVSPLPDRPGWIESPRRRTRSSRATPPSHQQVAAPLEDLESGDLLTEALGACSLRCEPALTVALDSMETPPETLAEATAIAEAWAREEAALWPDGEDGEPQGRLSAASVTAPYILMTVRTRHLRRGG